MKKQYSVADLKIGQKLEQAPFSLKEFEQKVSRQQKPYLNIKLGDKTGDIRGKVWSEKISKCDGDAKVGDIVSVSGTIQEYAGKPQIIIEALEVVTDMAPEEFLPSTSRDRGQMTSDLEDDIKVTKNPHLKQLMELFWNDEDWRDKAVNFPAGEYVHHGYVGGYLEHVWEMNELSKPFLKIYPQLDRDLLFTGIFFHDVGKLEELDIVGAAIIRTNEGKLVAHMGQGLLIVDDLLEQIPDFPEELKIKVYHMILSHQGSLEYGSPVVPQMLESLVLSMIDDTGAKMNQATKHIEQELASGNDFTDYHKWLRRSLYQKDFLEDSE